MQQIHGIHPGVFGKINPMRRLFQPTRLHELIKNRFCDPGREGLPGAQHPVLAFHQLV